MLARLSASSTACLARRTSPSLLRLSSQARFNSSEAPAQPAAGAEAAPKKRAIPIADSLGGISIASKGQRQQNGQRRDGNGDRRQNGNGNGDPNRPQRPRQNNFNRNGNGNNNRANAAGRIQNSDGQRNGQRFSRQRNETQDARSQDQRRPRQPRNREQGDEEDVPVNIPTPRKIELGNLEDIFGPPAASRAPRALKPEADSAKPLTDPKERIQMLLERTAGDYARYVPKPLSTTDVRELSPLELGSLVLSRRRDIKPQARDRALAVVGNFPATNTVAKGAEASAPPS